MALIDLAGHLVSLKRVNPIECVLGILNMWFYTHGALDQWT